MSLRESIRYLLMEKKPSTFFKRMQSSSYGLADGPFYVLAHTVSCPSGHGSEETVWQHSLATMDFLPPTQPLLRLAGLLHDVGKPYVYNPDLQSFHKHEGVGARITREWMTQLKWPVEDIKYVTRLVKYHMFFFEAHTTDRALRRWARKTRDLRDDLFYLRVADRAGNITKQDKELVTNAMLRLYERCMAIDVEDQQEKFKLAINGHDLIALGYEPSDLFSRAFTTLTEQVKKGALQNDRILLLAETVKLFRQFQKEKGYGKASI